MNIKNRLEIIEAKMNCAPRKNLIIKISRAGCSDNPVSWRNDVTGEAYAVDDDLSHLQGFNVLMANYSNDN